MKPDSLAPWFVWSVWIAMLTATLALAISYEVNIPWADEWDYAPVLGGARPVSLELFWDQHNEHRMPFSKLIWLLSLRLSGYDFRVLSFIHILGFAGLGAALILYAKLLRGYTSFTDALLPLLVLNPAHYQNLLWAWQIAYVLPVILIGVLLLTVVRSAIAGPSLTWRTIALVAACLVLLPLSGGAGVLFAPVFSLWLGYVALAHRQHPAPLARPKMWALLITNLAILLLIIVYFHGFHRPLQIPPTPGIQASLGTSLEVLTGSLGYDAGLAWPSLGWAMGALILASLAAVLVALSRPMHGHLTAIGFFLFLSAAALTPFGIGWSRAGLGVGAGLQPRYVTLMLPALMCIYFVWQIYSSPAVTRLVHVILFALILGTLPISAREALQFRQLRMQQMQAFRTDLLSGMPGTELVRRHATFLDHFADSPEQGEHAMQLMKQAGVALFRPLRNSSASFELARVGGNLDLVNEDQIAGWAWDEENPNRPVQVEILDGDTVLARVDAVLFRQDLLEAHIGGGDHAFTYSPPAYLTDGKVHKIRTVVKGVELQGSPKTFLSSRQIEFLASLSPMNVGGSLDVVDDNQISGWAWDQSRPNSHVQVEIFDGDTMLASVGAVSFRQDLLDVGIGHGDHAFTYASPVRIRDGKPHRIRVLVAGANTELPGSPKNFVGKR